MLKISEFSRLTQTPAKTLRFYDEIGLFKPSEVDRFTGYRYYTVTQLPDLYRILAFKELGFSLEQIKSMLQENLSAELIRGMLRLRQAELQQNIEREQIRLAYVESKLKLIELEGKINPYEIVIKTVEPICVVAVRGYAPSYAKIGETFGQLMGLAFQHVGQNQGQVMGGPIGIYYDEEAKEENVDMAVAIPIGNELPSTERVKVYELPSATMACVVHQGAFSEIGQAYNALMQWISQNAYQITGASREIYLKFDPQGDPAENITELQFPINK